MTTLPIAPTLEDVLLEQLGLFEEIAELGSWTLDLRSGAATWSTGLYRLLGYSAAIQAPAPEAYIARIHPDDIERVTATIAHHFRTNTPHDYRYRLVRPDQSVIIVRDRGRREFDAAGQPVRVLAVVQDITREATAEAKLATAANALDLALEGLLVVRADGEIRQVNRGFELITGYDLRRLTGGSPALRDLLDEPMDGDKLRSLVDVVQREGRWAGQLWLRHHDGHRIPVWCTVVWEAPDQVRALGRYVALMTDISQLERQRAKIAWSALHDDLTGLLLRAPFLRALLEATLQAPVAATTPAVLFLDLDGFKEINDSEGHAAGDAALRAVAAALTAALRSDDVVARFGGDEFAVLLPNTAPSMAMGVARKLCEAVHDAVPRLCASIGVACYPGSATDAEALLAAADRAMYAAKASGGGRAVSACPEEPEV